MKKKIIKALSLLTLVFVVVISFILPTKAYSLYEYILEFHELYDEHTLVYDIQNNVNVNLSFDEQSFVYYDIELYDLFLTMEDTRIISIRDNLSHLDNTYYFNSIGVKYLTVVLRDAYNNAFSSNFLNDFVLLSIGGTSAFNNPNDEYYDGYMDGFSAGKVSGYDDGFFAGDYAGYNNGYDDGLIDGYDDGYSVGLTDAASPQEIRQAGDTLIGFAGSIFGAGLAFILFLFTEFELFGVNMLTVLLAGVSLFIGIWIIKKVF